MFGLKLRRNARRIMAGLGGFVLPPVCPACRIQLRSEPESYCRDCAVRLQPMPSPRCRNCGGGIDGILDTCGECLAMSPRLWDHAVSVYHYEGLIRELIHRFKYNRGTWLAPAFATRMAESCRLYGGSVADCVTAVPLHWLRYLHRGYNQAELLARLVAAALGLEYQPLLMRARRTRQQALLDSKSRNQNMDGVFRAKSRKNIIGSRILLVDDVITTGSTLTAAASALKAAGAANVEILTLARG